MGPRLISRGDFSRDLHPFADFLASMGPRLISRGDGRNRNGNGADVIGFNGAAADQPRRLPHSQTLQDKAFAMPLPSVA